MKTIPANTIIKALNMLYLKIRATHSNVLFYFSELYRQVNLVSVCKL